MTDPLDPRRTALLLMDFQNAIVSRFPAAGAALERAVEAASAARAAGVVVGHVRVAFTEAESAAIPPTNQRFHQLAGSGAMAQDSPETQIHADLGPAAEDIVVRKIRVGALSTTDLAQQLRARGVDTLVLTGVATSGVVLSTLRDAADQDFRLLVLADACADGNPTVHEVLTGLVFPAQAEVLDTAEFVSRLAG
jgi:nicotinamidase-related amidase